MSTIFTSTQSSIFELPEPSEAQEEPMPNMKSLKSNHLASEEIIEDDSTTSECDCCSNHIHDEDEFESVKSSINLFLSESGESAADEEAAQLEKEQREQLKATTRFITRLSKQNYLKRRQWLLDVVVEKQNDDDSFNAEESERDHTTAMIKQMYSISQGEVCRKANWLIQRAYQRSFKSSIVLRAQHWVGEIYRQTLVMKNQMICLSLQDTW